MSIPFSKVSMGDEEKDAIVKVMDSGWLAAGPETEAFEQEFSTYISPEDVDNYYCIFTNSCTSALKMAYKIAKENGVLDVFYPLNTFCATYSAAEEVGIPTTALNIKYTDDSIKASLIGDSIVCSYTSMHYGGNKSDLPCFIEDSAHRIEPNDPLVGKIRCYSFYATKNMTTGSGGMFVTNDQEIYERARLFWKDGLTTSTSERREGPVDYEVKVPSGGYDGNDLAAAIGRVQLRRLPEFSARRNALRDRYNTAFGLGWMGNHLYCVDLGSEEKVREARQYLWDRGIASGYHYPGTGWTSISLPIYPSLTDSEQDQIIMAMREGGYV